MDEPDQGNDVPEPDGTSDVPGSRRSAARVLGRSAIALASATVLGLSAVGWLVTDRLSEVSSAKVLADVPDAPPPDDGATDVLLVGSDSRTDAQGNPLPLRVLKQLRTEATGGLNTDSLVLVRVPHSGAPPTAVSIPRDTRTETPSGRPEKINAVYGLTKKAAATELEAENLPPVEVERRAKVAGQRALVQTVQTLTGLRIDHYAELNLLGFFELTDAVGGVEVCLNSATRDKDSGADFSAGRQTVTGGDALSFVRQRHGLPRGDLDRIVRQQVFMAALANKVLSTGTLTDPAMVDDLVAATQRTVELDEAWDALGFVQQMQQIAAGRVSFVTMPVLSASARDERGQSIVAIDPGVVRRFFSELSAPPRMGPRPALRLDGTAHRQTRTDSAITADSGVPCVN